jgi:hypothetical protein
MKLRTATIAALVTTAVAVALALVFGAGESKQAQAKAEAVPGTPTIEIISPRNGARQTSHAAVVKIAIENFRLAPRQFGKEPQLGQGHVRYSLNRVPDCVDPVKLQRAIDSPKANGVVAEQIGTAGRYSPGTRAEIYYHDLKPGFYRMVVSLAQNNGVPTQFHAVTNFQILARPGHGPKPCADGKVPSAKAAARLR